MNIRAIVITLHYVGHLYHCPKCHRLVEGLEMNCRYCGQPLTTADNIHYRIHEHAVRFAAEMQQRAELYKQQAYRTYHVSPQNVQNRMSLCLQKRRKMCTIALHVAHKSVPTDNFVLDVAKKSDFF